MKLNHLILKITPKILSIAILLLVALPVFADELSPWVSQSQFEPEDKKSDVPVIVVTIVVIAVLVISFITYNFLSSVYWDRGVFPPFLLNRKVNHYEAITHIAVNIIRHDYDGRSEKIRLLQHHLSKKYPEIEGTVYHSYKAAFHEPLSTASTAKWLAKRIKSAEEKELLLNFLFRLAVLDERMGQREYLELQVFCQQMAIDQAVLTEKTETHRRAQAEQIREEEERREKIIAKSESNYLKNKYLFILGLSDTFTESDLKKAYRRWAKMCHPDMISTADAVEKAELEQRFLEIQEAYEYLMEINNQ